MQYLEQNGGFASKLCALYFTQFCPLALLKINKKNVGLKRTLRFSFMIPLMFQREKKMCFAHQPAHGSIWVRMRKMVQNKDKFR